MVAWPTCMADFSFGPGAGGVGGVRRSRALGAWGGRRRCTNAGTPEPHHRVRRVRGRRCGDPNGIHLYGDVIQRAVLRRAAELIAEWQSPNFQVLQERGFELMLLLVPIAFILRRPSLWEVLLTLTVSYLALSAVRHSALFVAAETPLLIWSFSAGMGANGNRRPGADVGRLGWAETWPPESVVSWSSPSSAPRTSVHGTLSNQARATAANFPVGASDWLAAHPTVGTHMFNQYGWGRIPHRPLLPADQPARVLLRRSDLAPAPT